MELTLWRCSPSWMSHKIYLPSATKLQLMALPTFTQTHVEELPRLLFTESFYPLQQPARPPPNLIQVENLNSSPLSSQSFSLDLLHQNLTGFQFKSRPAFSPCESISIQYQSSSKGLEISMMDMKFFFFQSWSLK